MEHLSSGWNIIRNIKIKNNRYNGEEIKYKSFAAKERYLIYCKLDYLQ
jgi:hypothetical protein